jgi:hypothetical protein
MSPPAVILIVIMAVIASSALSCSFKEASVRHECRELGATLLDGTAVECRLKQQSK